MDREDFEDEFFIIDTDNLNEVESRLYGYVINNNEIIQNDNYDENVELLSSGAYILITANDDSITIKQDFNGSYGLYVFEGDGYFAVSNSFLKLVNYLKYTQSLSFNKNYADSFLFTSLAATGYMDTMVNEIKSIPRNYVITIDKINKKISYDAIDYEEMSIPLDSQKAFDLIDAWYEKWINIIRSIKEQTNALSVDLSGGFDSRVVSALWLSANIDFDKFRIKSHKHHEEDYSIAEKISELFNFHLNRGIPRESSTFRYDEIQTPLNNSFNLKLGFHKQMYFKAFRTEETLYSITGEAGGSLRGFSTHDMETFMQNKKNIICRNNPALYEGAKIDIENALSQVIDNLNLDEDSPVLPQMHYNETRLRYHYGKAAIESYFSNTITLAPLIDENLRKINYINNDLEDDKALISIIFLRFCPQLLNFEFEGNREIDPKTLEYAKRLNEKYPYAKRDLPFVSGPEIPQKDTPDKVNENHVTRADINNFLKEVFYSNKFQKEFEKYYTFKDYSAVMNSIDEKKSYPLTNVYSAIAIVTITKAVEFSKEINDKPVSDWLEGFIDGNPQDNTERIMQSLSEKYSTARVDIKNRGAGNSVEVFDVSDKSSDITYPKWIRDENGSGCVVASMAGSLKFKVRCVNDGELVLRLKTRLFKDKNKNEFPVYIDITRFEVDEENVISENHLVSHSQYFQYKKDVKDGDVITIELDWLPFNESSEYELDYNKLDYNKLDYEKIKYPKLNYGKLNYNKIDYEKLDYDKLNYEKFNYEKLNFKKLNTKKLVKSKSKKVVGKYRH